MPEVRQFKFKFTVFVSDVDEETARESLQSFLEEGSYLYDMGAENVDNWEREQIIIDD